MTSESSKKISNLPPELELGPSDSISQVYKLSTQGRNPQSDWSIIDDDDTYSNEPDAYDIYRVYEPVTMNKLKDLAQVQMDRYTYKPSAAQLINTVRQNKEIDSRRKVA